MKNLLIVLPVLFLAGCSATSQTVTTTRLEVVVPDRSLFKCESVRYPNHKELTDAQVARIITELHRKNAECKNSVESIRKFLEEAKTSLESK
jgi:uncharacterized lipoprotein YajG